METFWYLLTKEIFAEEIFISPALIQRVFGLSYYQSRLILDQLIREGFCEPQVGAQPCKILHLAN